MIATALACAQAPSGPAASRGAPEVRDRAESRAGWAASRPAAEDLDPAAVAGVVDRLRARTGTRSLLVLRRGRLVVEEYFRGQDRDRAENLKSASKGLLSALVGIALSDGALRDLDQPVAGLLPEEFAALEDEGGGRAITLRHLLTMTAGLASTSGEAYGPWVASRDWVAAALARPRVAAPGEEFIYSTGNTHLLSAILTRATGRSTLEFARRRLFEPLGIAAASWQRSPRGIYFGGNNLTMTPRDLARFGQLYLQEGAWEGRRLIPADWVAESTRAHAEGWPDRYGRYGYLWWVRPAAEGGAFLAAGYGGQFLYVAPREEMVVVLISTAEGKGEAWDREVLAELRRLTAAAGRADAGP